LPVSKEKMNLKTRLPFICAQIAFAACAQGSAPGESSGPSVKAGGVRVEAADPKGRIEIVAEELVFEDAGARMRLNGNASVKVEGAAGLEARASHITLLGSASKIELSGGVEARFKVRDRGGRDAGR
jgi:hypothetical protein